MINHIFNINFVYAFFLCFSHIYFDKYNKNDESTQKVSAFRKANYIL